MFGGVTRTPNSMISKFFFDQLSATTSSPRMQKCQCKIKTEGCRPIKDAHYALSVRYTWVCEFCFRRFGS